MAFLNTLAAMRTPLLIKLASLVTMLGEDTLIVILVMAILWCLHRQNGYRLVITVMTALAVTTLLKMIFMIPRPYVIQPGLAVESAMGYALDYSFPSGHTTNATAIFFGLAFLSKKRWAWIPALVLSVMVAFSRMFLGVHTPQDVSVGFVIGLCTAIGMHFLFVWAGEDPQKMQKILAGSIALSLITLIYCLLAPEGNTPSAQLDGQKNAFSLLAVLLAAALSFLMDKRRDPEIIRAVWWAQIIKLLIGVGIMAGLRAILKAILPDIPWVSGVRYLMMLAPILMLWPMTFPFWQKLGSKK